jgi:hypothetical protein
MRPTENAPMNFEGNRKTDTETGLKPGGSNSAQTRMEPDFYKIL